MQIVTLREKMNVSNAYIVENGGRAFVVDAGGRADEIFEKICALGATLEAILITHAHYDHIAGVARLLELADEKAAKDGSAERVKVLVHKADFEKIATYKNLGTFAGVKVEPFVPDILLVGGETLCIAGISVKVIHTPGHSLGGVCYVMGDVIFTGDTLFAGSFGRTDFYDGNFADLKNSIVNKLFRLNGDYRVLAGHMGETSIEQEKKYNPILFE